MKQLIVWCLTCLPALIGFSDDALKGLYHFEEQSGHIAADASGNGNDAVLVNDPLWVSEGAVNCLQFDKTLSTYLNCGTGLSLDGSGDFTLSGHLRTTSNSKMTILFQRADSSEQFDGLSGSYTLNVDGKGRMSFHPHTGGKQLGVDSTVKLNDGRWHHFAVVRVHHTVKIYIDGRLDVEKAGIDLSFNSHIPTVAGAQVTQSTGRYFFHGQLDDLAVHSRALRPEEITFYANVRNLLFGQDEDQDGLTNNEEFIAGTNPYHADEDGDGLSDQVELAYGTDPSVPNGNVKAGFELRAIGTVDHYSVTYDQLTDAHDLSVRSDDIGNSSDNFVFIAKPLGAASRLTVKLSNYGNASNWSKAGIMVRDDYTQGSRHGFTFLTGKNGAGLQHRQAASGRAEQTMGFGKGSLWLTIVCHNNRVTGYVAENINNAPCQWIKLSEQSLYLNPTTKVGLAVASCNRRSTVSVRLAGLETAAAVDTDGDGLTDWEEVHVEKTIDIFADTENDGLPDGAELLAGTHPHFPETTLDHKLFHRRGLISRYFNGIYSALPQFNELPVYAVGTADLLYFPAVKTDIVGSTLNKGAAAFSGKLYIETAGDYTFYTRSNDGSELFINDTLTVANGGLHGIREREGQCQLTAGFHDIKIHFFNTTGDGTLKLFWKGPNFARQPIPASVLMHAQVDYSAAFAQVDQDGDGLTDKLEETYGSDKTKADSNGDGLSDFEKYTLGLAPMKLDTDGDGISDYDEVKHYLSDPKTIDFDGTETVLATVHGAEATTVKGEWEKSGNAIFSIGRNGALDYTINLPEEGMFMLRISGRQHNSLSEYTAFMIDVYTNSLYTDRQTLETTAGGTADYVLPYLPAGTHKITLNWINVLTRHALEITSLQLVKVNGPDTDGNGKLDWQDYRLDHSSAFKKNLPVKSATSPFCAEGLTLFDDSVALTGSYDPQDGNYTVTADGKVVVPVSCGIETYVGKTWYANAPLDPNGVTTLTADFQNAAKVVSHKVTWTATNIFTEDEITIRQGDSLLLTALPENELPGKAAITVDGTTHPVTCKQPLQHCFDHPGTRTVTAVFTNAAGTVFNAGLNIKVIAAKFEKSPVLFVNALRCWDNAGVPQEAVLNYSSDLSLYRYALGADGSRLEMLSSSIKPKKIVARLWADGPILDAQSIKTLKRHYGAGTDGTTVITTFPDGSKLVEYEIIMTEIPADFSLTITIFVGGVTFEDGTLTKTFTAADFDEYGRLAYRMIRSEGVKTGNCHRVNYFINGIKIY